MFNKRNLVIFDGYVELRDQFFKPNSNFHNFAFPNLNNLNDCSMFEWLNSYDTIIDRSIGTLGPNKQCIMYQSVPTP